MSSEITPHERALIDAAIAAGKVTRVPAGASSLWNYTFDPERKKLVHQDTLKGIKHKPGYFLGRAQHGPKPSPEVAARRAEVRRLHDEGLGRAEVAERLGVPYNTIVADYVKLGIRPNAVPRQTRQTRETEERLKQLEALLDDGTIRNAKQLRTILGVNEGTFWKYMQRLGRTLPREIARTRATPAQTAARRAFIKDAHARGAPLTVTALMEQYGVSQAAIYQDLKILGIKLLRGGGRT